MFYLFVYVFFQNELKDVEEKFRKAMVANASMDNEKSALTYQVELLKDQLEECEEQSALVTKELREKSRDYELLKRSHQETQRAVQLLQVFDVLFFIAFCSFFHIASLSSTGVDNEKALERTNSTFFFNFCMFLNPNNLFKFEF